MDGQQHQDPVSSAFPPGLVRCGDESVSLGWGQERDDPLVEPLGWDGQNPLDQQGVLGVAQCRVGEQRADRCQSHVAGSDAVMSLVLQMIQESGDHRRVQVVPVELGGHPVGLLVYELKEGVDLPHGRMNGVRQWRP